MVFKRPWRNDSAVSQVIGFLIAGAMFSATLGAVILVSIEKDTPQTKASESAAQAAAGSLADLFTNSQGQGWFAGTKCLAGKENSDAFAPDLVSRFGLASEPCDPSGAIVPGNLSFSKLTDLQRAALAADASNGHLDYEEARKALGLDEAGLDFHIRTEPVLGSIRSILASGYQDPNLRPAYVGDYSTSASSPITPNITVGAINQGSKVTLWAHIHNNGITGSLFEVDYTLHLSQGDVTLIRHTPIVLPGQSYNLTLDLTKSSDWAWSTSVIDYTVSDPLNVLKSGQVSLSGIPMTAASAAKNFNVHVGKVQYDLSNGPASPKVYYGVFRGDGTIPSHLDWKIEIYDQLGLLVASDSALHSRGWETFTVLLPGVYDVRLKTQLGSLLASERLVVVAAALGGWSVSGSTSYTPQQSAIYETAYVDALIQHFDPGVFSQNYTHILLPHVAGGDVYPDVKSVMNNDLPAKLIDDKGTPTPTDDEATLAHYNVLIVGSNVDHQVMTSQAAKDAIRDWVYAGGTLVVFGSHDQAVQWLQPIFHSSITSASGGIGAPDESHPVLRVPNQLDYLAFDSHGIGWQFTRDEDRDHFTHVIEQGSNDLMSLSDHGEFGAGRVLLTAYQPFDLLANGETGCDPAALTEACDGLRLLHNLVTQGYAGLFVDYGPPLPTDRTVGSSIRLASVWHPELERAIALRVQVYVF